MGLVFGALTTAAVLLLVVIAEDAGKFGALFVWVLGAPVTTIVVMSAARVALWRLEWPLQRWWWTIALPPVLALILAFGTVAGGPAGTTAERATGWAAVSLALVAGVAVAAGRRVAGPVRILAAVVAIAAAPVMIVHDRTSQDRWREAAHTRELAARASILATVPEVLPVVPGYRPSATGGRNRSLQVDLTGPTTELRIWITYCPTCEARTGTSRRTLVVDGYALVVAQFDGRTEMLTTLTDVDIRPASRAELAALPAAAYDDGYGD